MVIFYTTTRGQQCANNALTALGLQGFGWGVENVALLLCQAHPQFNTSQIQNDSTAVISGLLWKPSELIHFRENTPTIHIGIQISLFRIHARLLQACVHLAFSQNLHATYSGKESGNRNQAIHIHPTFSGGFLATLSKITALGVPVVAQWVKDPTKYL